MKRNGLGPESCMTNDNSVPRHSRRPLVRTIAVVALVSLSLIVGAYSWFQTSLPSVGGRLALPGLEMPVTITRNKYGVPTIVSQNDHDAAFALGFVHAQDRLFQMDIM